MMSLILAEEMIFSLRARGHANCVDFYMIPYIRAHILGIGSANTRKRHPRFWKESHHELDHLVRDGRWMGSIFTSYSYDLILLH
jgi:hypothetical protein